MKKSLKRLFAAGLTAAMVMSMGMTAFAYKAEGGVSVGVDSNNNAVVAADESSVAIYKIYTATGSNAVNPAETFKFAIEAVGQSKVESGIKAEDFMPTFASTVEIDNITYGTVSYEKGEADVDGNKKPLTLNLPEYTSVGIYEYKITEVDNEYSGVTYFNREITLKVTVVQDPDNTNGKLRIAAVHCEEANGTKIDEFDNVYTAGQLSVEKTVTGNLGDKNKAFKVYVTFESPEDGTTVMSDITYNVAGGAEQIINGNWTGTHDRVEVELKHGDTVVFKNIPDGVKYTVVEDDSYATNDAYDAAQYSDELKSTPATKDNTQVSANGLSGTINETEFL